MRGRNLHKPRMRLHNNIQPPRPDEAIRPGEAQAFARHDVGDADGCGARDADAAVD